IVNVSSMGYALNDVRIDDYNFEEGKAYHPWLGYSQSKTANVQFDTYLAGHLKDKGVQCFAIQPGMPQTDLYYHVNVPKNEASLESGMALAAKIYPNRPSPAGDPKEDEKTIETAASTLVYAALPQSLMVSQFLRFLGFLINCKPFAVESYATNRARAEKLWKLSEKHFGGTFDI
ncbi:putative short-chain dehydrogenase TIC 32, chloroplastic, partial [Halenospora varia]